MKSQLLFAAIALLSAASSADAAVELESVRVVGRADAAAPWSSSASEARLADHPELAVVALGRVGKRRVVIADPDIRPLLIDGKRVREASLRTWTELGDDLEVRWYQVEPHAWREPGEPAPNGATSRYHSNVSTEPSSFGKWLGYDRITYFESALGSWQRGKGARIRRALVAPHDPSAPDHDGLGTMRFKVELRWGGRVLASPGAEATDRYGILPSVYRLSVRLDDTITGHLAAYFLVPEVFGSAGAGRNHQTERFVGADCADVITGAARRAGFVGISHTNVAGLTRYARRISESVAIDAEGQPDSPVIGVARGDIIRINYGGALANHTPRSWDHVALLWEDRSDPSGPSQGGPNGQLDGFDLIAHMGHPRLEVEPLSGQAPATIDVLRWDPGRMGKRRTPRR